MSSSTIEGIENGEFLILTDESFHAVGQSGLQIQLSPVVLHVTNRRIIIEPQFDIEMTRNIDLSTITGFKHDSVNDIPVLAIHCGGSEAALCLFIPDDTRKRVFQEIVDHMHKVSTQPPQIANKAMLALRHSIHESPTIQHFYENYRGPPEIETPTEKVEVEDPKVKEKVTLSKVRSFLAPWNFVANFIDVSPRLLGVILCLLVAVLSVVFQHFSFGAVVSAGGLTFIVILGIQKLLGVDHTIEEVNIEKVQDSMQPFFRSSNAFYAQVNTALFWAERSAALQLGAFCLVLLLLFVLFHPTFLLFVSLVGLAFFERWNMLGFGSLSTILSHLILW
jgi:hypothetical protein